MADKDDFFKEIQNEYNNGQLYEGEYTFTEIEIKNLQAADAEQLERETIKFLLQIYERSMNTAEMMIKIIEHGDNSGKTKEVVSQCYGEANKAMANMISLIKSKKSLNMNKLEMDTTVDDDKYKIGIDEFHKLLESYDGK